MRFLLWLSVLLINIVELALLVGFLYFISKFIYISVTTQTIYFPIFDYITYLFFGSVEYNIPFIIHLIYSILFVFGFFGYTLYCLLDFFRFLHNKICNYAQAKGYVRNGIWEIRQKAE